MLHPKCRNKLPDCTATLQVVTFGIHSKITDAGGETPKYDSDAVENYFDKLPAWNKETGLGKMININNLAPSIYEEDKDLTEAMARLKLVVANGAPHATYAQVNTFFDGIGKIFCKSTDRTP